MDDVLSNNILHMIKQFYQVIPDIFIAYENKDVVDNVVYLHTSKCKITDKGIFSQPYTYLLFKTHIFPGKANYIYIYVKSSITYYLIRESLQMLIEYRILLQNSF